MFFLTLLLIAIGLAMDAFAVSVSAGIATKEKRLVTALRVSVFFGAFQAFMPLFGWVAGFSVFDYIAVAGHWIAFFLLAAIGIKMIAEGLKENNQERVDISGYKILTLLAIVTSIDALAVGFSFAFLKLPVVIPAMIIGIVTFAISFVGFYLGGRCGHLIGSKAEVAGGLILIATGVKILITDPGLM